MPIYELVLDTDGPKFQESKRGPDGKLKEGAIIRPGDIEAYHIPMDIVARALSQFSGRIVMDRTDLKGGYDFKLDWTPESAEPQAPTGRGDSSSDTHASADLSGPSLFTALRDQLGLKLRSAKGPVPVVVVESVSLPQPN